LKIIPVNKVNEVVFKSGVSITKSNLPTTINFFGKLLFIISLRTSYFPFTISKTTSNRFNMFITERTFTFMGIIVITKKTRVFKAPLMND
jgi:hypothetical protein